MKIPWLMDCDYASYKWFGMFIDEKMKNILWNYEWEKEFWEKVFG